MKSLSRITTAVLIVLALAVGVALADGPGSSRTTVATGDRPAATTSSSSSVDSLIEGRGPDTAPAAGLSPVEAAAVAAIEETDSDDNELDDDAEGCARLLEKLETINAAFDDTVLEVLLNLPPEVAVKIVATLEVTRERTTASLVAALLACEELTATTTSTTPGSTTTTLPNGAASCAELAAERASVNDAFDAAEAELTETIAGPDLVAAIASLEAARAEANAAYDTAMAACAAVTSTVPPASTTSTTAAIPAATCAEILAERAAFNAEIDAVEAKLNTVLAPALAQEVIAGVELQRAEANARFDAALASCSP